MEKSVSGAAIRLAGVAALAATLTGCGGMTYGTGTSPGAQTLQDVMGIASLGGKKKVSIDYAPRAPIVAPPTTASLPPPGSAPSTAAAANWPTDPDETRRNMKKKEEEERVLASDSVDEFKHNKNPKFMLPHREGVEYPGPVTRNDSDPQAFSKAKRKEIQKMFADARGKGGAYDAEGHPVRKYLTEPPAVYREPDPNSPVEITEKPKKKNKFSLKSLWPF